MSGHFPFAAKRGIRYGQAPRMAIAAFFEHHGFNTDLQEKYYKWWYDWARNAVAGDPDLNATKGVEFTGYPYGQHALHSFHLNDKMWAAALSDLGDFIRDLILPKLDEKALHALESQHDAMLHTLAQEATQKPRTPPPEVGYFRHV
ncbi:MAG: hypothetical protein B7Z66_03725 [Chromatiales bacterium 21-64-14]|nr:MAG: hypothetical protein B7Z66_03725 [Chromatiales bacterium 21-64-14]HQU14812.1 hypothetical protein [Gammaproteobacteria bacterium]